MDADGGVPSPDFAAPLDVKPLSSQTQSALRPSRFRFRETSFERYTHYLFRYPAKFHPPIARALISEYSKPGDVILDPFCGSGTLLVEARAMGRRGIGIDVDPVAVFISMAKTRPISVISLAQSAEKLKGKLEQLRRSEQQYKRLQYHDISVDAVRYAVKRNALHIPQIPNLYHWFRKYVVVDLARMKKVIRYLNAPKRHKVLFMACFCSIIRNVSNADPVPVSGLEVTAHMKARDAKGRIIDPFKHYFAALERAIEGMKSFARISKHYDVHVQIRRGDSTQLRKYVRKSVDVVVTSPPYHHAVDYYRRHTLEMYWLGFARDHTARLKLLPRYIGRARVPRNHRFISKHQEIPRLASIWERRIRKHDASQADAFRHYVVAMSHCFRSLASLQRPGGTAVFVVGKSSWNGQRLPTTQLFKEVAGPTYKLIRNAWYPLQNRYMTYSRRNKANIDKEHVLVFRRRRSVETGRESDERRSA